MTEGDARGRPAGEGQEPPAGAGFTTGQGVWQPLPESGEFDVENTGYMPLPPLPDLTALPFTEGHDPLAAPGRGVPPDAPHWLPEDAPADSGPGPYPGGPEATMGVAAYPGSPSYAAPSGHSGPPGARYPDAAFAADNPYDPGLGHLDPAGQPGSLSPAADLGGFAPASPAPPPGGFANPGGPIGSEGRPHPDVATDGLPHPAGPASGPDGLVDPLESGPGPAGPPDRRSPPLAGAALFEPPPGGGPGGGGPGPAVDVGPMAPGPGSGRSPHDDVPARGTPASEPTPHPQGGPSDENTAGAQNTPDAPTPGAAPDPGAAQSASGFAGPLVTEGMAQPHPEPGTQPQPQPEAPDTTAAVDPGLEHPVSSYALRVNGTDRPVTDAWLGESLLYVLRERLGLAGAKDGCEQGECGACSVQVDGRLVAACLVPAATAAGCEVRTVEGLPTDGEPSDVQRALAASGAVQCGYCVPGLAMAVHDLLAGNHHPTPLQTRQALCGNLCRCTGYRGVLAAVREVIASRADEARREDGEAPPLPHQITPTGQVDSATQAAPGGVQP